MYIYLLKRTLTFSFSFVVFSLFPSVPVWVLQLWRRGWTLTFRNSAPRVRLSILTPPDTNKELRFDLNVFFWFQASFPIFRYKWTDIGTDLPIG